MPTATVITSAFLNHARAAAKHVHNDDLPLVVPPHPLYDLAPEELRKVAQLAYPLLLACLVGDAPDNPVVRVPYQRPDAGDAGSKGTV